VCVSEWVNVCVCVCVCDFLPLFCGPSSSCCNCSGWERSISCLHSHDLQSSSPTYNLPHFSLSLSLLPLLCKWTDVWDAWMNVYVLSCRHPFSMSSTAASSNSSGCRFSCKNMQFYRSLQICHKKKKKNRKTRKEMGKKNYIAELENALGLSGKWREYGGDKRVAWKTFAKQKCKYLSYRKHALPSAAASTSICICKTHWNFHNPPIYPDTICLKNVCCQEQCFLP